LEVLSNIKCVIGEGPVWNDFDKKVYQVNGFKNQILAIDPKTKEVAVRQLDFSVAAMGFSKKGEMLVSCLDGVFILNNDNSRTPIYDTNKYEIKYGNDAKVGPDGRFYVGTQSSKRYGTGNDYDGKLYSIGKDGTVKIVLDNLILSNGFDWSMDEKRLYHTDSETGIIKEYNFDKATGNAEFTGRQIAINGVDGFTIDERDFLYATNWGSGSVTVINSENMQIVDKITLPATAPASCGFAGENMEKLVIVTATFDVDLAKDENAGLTFICDVKAKGRKPYLFG